MFHKHCSACFYIQVWKFNYYMYVKKSNMSLKSLLRKSFLSDGIMCSLSLTWRLSLQLHGWSRFQNGLLDFRRQEKENGAGDMDLQNPLRNQLTLEPTALSRIFPLYWAKPPSSRLFQEPSPQQFPALFASRKPLSTCLDCLTLMGQRGMPAEHWRFRKGQVDFQWVMERSLKE